MTRTVRSWSRALPFLLVLALGVAPLAASPQVDPDATLDIDLKDAPAQQVFLTFATILGAQLDLDPQLGDKLSVELHGVPIFEALDGVCQAHGCDWRLVDGTPPILEVKAAGGEAGAAAGGPRVEPITVALVDADVREVLFTFRGMVGAGSVYIDPSLKGTLSLHLAEVPWSDALDAVCKLAGCTWSFDEASGELRFEAVAGGARSGNLGEVRLTGPSQRKAPEAAARGRARSPLDLAMWAEAPASEQPVQGTARFSWNERTVRMRLGEGWEAALAWIPLGAPPGLDVVLPLLVQCPQGTDGATVYPLDPVVLPLAEARSREAAGARLRLAPAGERKPLAVDTLARGESCAAWKGLALKVSRGGVTLGATLEAPGDVVQIAFPPPAEHPTSNPEATMVVVGRDPVTRGVQLLLLAPDGRGGVVQRSSVVTPGLPAQVTAPLSDGRELELELELQGG